MEEEIKQQRTLVLAKSEPEISLRQHIDDCLHIMEQLKNCVPDVPVGHKQAFWKILSEAIVFHDMGKVHPEFQKLLHKQPEHW